MPPLIAKHHTLADWDFEEGATYRSLSATQFISAPTSLRMLNPTTADFLKVTLCRIPATLCLPQGEVRTWVYAYLKNFSPAIFRNQAPLGSANGLNCYQVYLAGTNSYLYRYIGGVILLRDQDICQTFSYTWTRYRVFWYNGKTPGEVPALCVDIYREVYGEWQKCGRTLYDTDNTWEDSAINRAGFKVRTSYNYAQYWDNTEIWGPV